eukprot:7326740-Lingulodinium_polyedra.AAC.1
MCAASGGPPLRVVAVPASDLPGIVAHFPRAAAVLPAASPNVATEFDAPIDILRARTVFAGPGAACVQS